MPLQPKFQRQREAPQSRPFVDREELIDGFWQALGRPGYSQPRVLVYYGLGGIGKSRLRRELRDRLARSDPPILFAEVDFRLTESVSRLQSWKQSL